MSFAGILKLLYSNGKTGLLKVQSAEGELLLHFREGKIINVEMPRGQEWIIGQYLTQGEVLSSRRLVKALDLAAKKNKTPEDVLVDKRYISPDVLKRYMDLYTREVILPLFGKVGLVCSFQAADEPIENKWLPPVSVPYLLKEGERRAREWPLLNKRIPTSDIVYVKDKSFISQVVKDGEENGSPLFSDKLDPELGANERIIYYFVDGRRSVKQLARASGLDLFSTYRAMHNLEGKFMVKVTKTRSTGINRENTVIPYLVKALFYGIIIIALAGLTLLRPGLIKVATGEEEVDIHRLTDAQHRADQEILRQSLSTFFLERLTCPTNLNELVTRGLVTGINQPYHLHCEAESGYELQLEGKHH